MKDNKEKEALRVIQEEVYHVGGKRRLVMNTRNGLPEVDELREEKRKFLDYLMTHLQQELITTKKAYPVDDKLDVDLEADFMVIKRTDFHQIVEYILGDE